MGKATDKQLDYAYAIADYLGLKRPENTFEECYRFISVFSGTYKAKRRNIVGDFIESGHPKFDDYVNTFGTFAVSWIEENLHNVSGVYAFLGKRNKLLYIGKSKDLASRIPSSWTERRGQAEIKRVLYYPTPTQADASVLEMYLITDKKPLLNVDGNTKDRPKMFWCNIDIKKDFREIPIRKEAGKDGGTQNVCENDY